jgi:hypothetical protein
MAEELASPMGGAAVLQAARELAPVLAERAGESEAMRTMPHDLAERSKRAGLFRLALPRSLGGLELEPATIVEIVETLSRADGSAGWTVLIGNSTAFFAWLEPTVAKQMIGDNANFASAAVFAPMGRAAPIAHDSFTVSGRWPFNSGCLHSEWLQLGVFVVDGDTPRFRDKDIPDWRFAFVENEDSVIEDTWDALGLRGTGSHHLSLTEARLPAEHLAAPLFEPARHEAGHPYRRSAHPGELQPRQGVQQTAVRHRPSHVLDLIESGGRERRPRPLLSIGRLILQARTTPPIAHPQPRRGRILLREGTPRADPGPFPRRPGRRCRR